MYLYAVQVGLIASVDITIALAFQTIDYASGQAMNAASTICDLQTSYGGRLVPSQ
jgi:hypothetical protein